MEAEPPEPLFRKRLQTAVSGSESKARVVSVTETAR